MKALQIVQYGELKAGLEFKETKQPDIQSTDILIETHAAGLNPIDYKLVSGALKEMVPLDFPATIGFDVSGKVVKVGADVTGFEIGDAVFTRVPHHQMGTVAEYVAADTSVVAKKPENASFEEVAGLPLVGLTAIQAFERVGLEKDDKILIHAGSGGVGSFAIQYAKSKGAYVYTTTSTKNVNWVKDLGADRVIDYKKEDYKSVVSNLDLVFDTLGGDYTKAAFEIIRQEGKITSIASAPDEEAAARMGIEDYEFPESLAQLREQKSANYKFTWMQPNGKQLEAIADLVQKEVITPIVDQVYSFENGIEAYQHLATERAQGKVIIQLK